MNPPKEITDLFDFFDADLSFRFYDNGENRMGTDLKKDAFEFTREVKSFSEFSIEVTLPNIKIIIPQISNYFLSLDFLTFSDGKNIYQIKRFCPES